MCMDVTILSSRDDGVWTSITAVDMVGESKI